MRDCHLTRGFRKGLKGVKNGNAAQNGEWREGFGH